MDDWRTADLYDPADASRLAFFMKREWDNLVAHFYHNLQEEPHDIRRFIARVRDYASGRPGFSVVQPLLSEAYQDAKLWKQYLSGMQYELKRPELTKEPRVPRPIRAAPPPGIPLGPEYADQASEELGLPLIDARQAVRHVEPSGGRIRVEGYGRQIFHETVHSRAGMGVRNLSRNADVISFFYVQEGADCFLVAWGEHVEAPRGQSRYRIVRQARNVTGVLEGKTVTFQ